jgi:leader peptidase (prepilin peptidase) / N-methyltransferase
VPKPVLVRLAVGLTGRRVPQPAEGLMDLPTFSAVPYSTASLEFWGLLAAAPMIGSFIGVVIRRLPETAAIVWDRSRCEHCHAVLAPRDLVPLLSWFVARGRCRRCGATLDWFYPAVELAAVLIALISVVVDRGGKACLDAGLGWWLLAAGWIDLRTWLLPDMLTLPLIVFGLVEASLLAPGGLIGRATGAALGYLGLWTIALLYRGLRGRDGLGRGDAKLLAAAGAWVGASALPSVLLIGAAAALLAAGGLMACGTRLDRFSALPFGPFLALAAWLVWLFGPLRW